MSEGGRVGWRERESNIKVNHKTGNRGKGLDIHLFTCHSVGAGNARVAHRSSHHPR